MDMLWICYGYVALSFSRSTAEIQLNIYTSWFTAEPFGLVPPPDDIKKPRSMASWGTISLSWPDKPVMSQFFARAHGMRPIKFSQ